MCRNYSPCLPTWQTVITFCNSSNIQQVYQIQNGTTCDAFPFATNYSTQSCVYCVANWTSIWTGCLSGEQKIGYFVQNGTSCNNVSPPANLSESCDYNGNNIIGNEGSIISSKSFNLIIDDQRFNDSVKYNNSDLFVELKEGNVSRVEFNFNFNDSNKLDLNRIRITIQSSGDSLGYIEVNGLEVEKTVRLERKNSNSNLVCVRNSSSGTISANCDSSSEYVIQCDNSNHGGYTCNSQAIDNKSYFVVTGLTHSSAREYVNGSSVVLGGENNVGGGCVLPMVLANGTCVLPSTDCPLPRILVNGVCVFPNATGCSPPRILVNGTCILPISSSSGEGDNGKNIIFWVVIGALIIGILVVGGTIFSLLKKNKEGENKTPVGVSGLVNSGPIYRPPAGSVGYSR